MMNRKGNEMTKKAELTKALRQLVNAIADRRGVTVEAQEMEYIVTDLAVMYCEGRSVNAIDRKASQYVTMIQKAVLV